MDSSRSHVFWLGGSPCAGKSTIADRLAAAHGLSVYRCDDAFYRHKDLVTPEDQPVFARLARASCDEVWMRPVARQIAEEIALYREEFPFILADLVALPANRPVIAEGAALLPEVLAGFDVDFGRALWIVPTEEFQRRRYAQREWRHDVLRPCADPDQAWRNWMDRDAGFARFVAADARRRGGRLLVVDGTRSIADNLRTVEGLLGLRLPAP